MFRNQNLATCINGPKLGPISTTFGAIKTTPIRATSSYNNGTDNFARADALWKSGHKAEALQEFQAIFDSTHQKDIPQYVCKLLFEGESELCKFSDLLFWCSSAAYAGISNDLILNVLVKHVSEQLENVSEDVDSYRNFFHRNISALREEVSNLRKDVKFINCRREMRKKSARREQKTVKKKVNKISCVDRFRNDYNPNYLSVVNDLYNDVIQNALLWNLGYGDSKYLSDERDNNDNKAKCKCRIFNLAKGLCKAKSMRNKCKMKLCVRLKKIFDHRQMDIFNWEFVHLEKVSMNMYKKLIFFRGDIVLSPKSDVPKACSSVKCNDTKSEVEEAINHFCTGNEDILRRLLNRSCIDKTILLEKSLEEFCKDHDVVLKRLIDLSTVFREKNVGSDNSLDQQSLEENAVCISSLDIKEDSSARKHVTALTDITNSVISCQKTEIKPSINSSISENVEISKENTINKANTNCCDEIDSFTSLEMYFNDNIGMTELFTSETLNYGKVGRGIDCMELLTKFEVEEAINHFCTGNEDILRRLLNRSCIDKTILLEKLLKEFCKDHDVVLKRLIDLSTVFREKNVASDNSLDQQSLEENAVCISSLDIKEDSSARKHVTALTDITNSVISCQKTEIKPSINSSISENVEISKENTINKANTNCCDEIDSFTSLEMYFNDNIGMTELFTSETLNYGKVGRGIDCMELLTKFEVEEAINHFCTGNEDILRRLLNRSCIDKTILLEKLLKEFCKDHDVVLKRLIDLSTVFREKDVASDNSLDQQSLEENAVCISSLGIQLDIKEDSNTRKHVTALTDITNRLNTTEGLNSVISCQKTEIKPSINSSISENVKISKENTIGKANTNCCDEIDSVTSLEMFFNDSIGMTELFTSETSNYGKVGREIDCMELLIERACKFDAANGVDIANGLDILDAIFDEGISDSPFYEYCEGESSDYREYSSSSQEDTLSSFKNCYSVRTFGSPHDVDKGYSSEDTVYSGEGFQIDKTSPASSETEDCSSSSFSLVDDSNIWFNYVASISKKYNIKNYLLQCSKRTDDVSVKFNINLGSNIETFADIILNCNLGEDFLHTMLAEYPVGWANCDSCIKTSSSDRFLNCNNNLRPPSRLLDTMSCVKDIISRWPEFQSRLLQSKYMCLFLLNIRLHSCKMYSCRLPLRGSELFLRNFIMVNAPFLSNHCFYRL